MRKITRQQITIGLVTLAALAVIVIISWLVARVVHASHTTSASSTTATPTVVYMSDSQASTWAANYPALMVGKSLRASVAAANVMLPLMNMQLTAAQITTYNVPQVNDSVRTVITARSQTPQSTIDQVDPLTT